MAFLRELRDGPFAKAQRHWTHQALLEGGITRGLYLRLRPHLRDLAPRPGTEITIEGYPRSANTYSVAAFTLSNPSVRHIARHLHSTASIEWSVNRGLPTVLLIRAPDDCVASFMCRYPGMNVDLGLSEYIRFYSRLLAVADRVTVAPFRIVTQNFGIVISSVNARFGTSFALYRNTDDNERAVRALVEEMEREDSGGRPLREHMVARPSASRASAASEFKRVLREHHGFARATALYEEYLALPDCVGTDTTPNPLS